MVVVVTREAGREGVPGLCMEKVGSKGKIGEGKGKTGRKGARERRGKDGEVGRK